ncbi:MAG: sigma-70 family RNA polymerase sigma factor [Verrucomicrobiales bacterium]|nr:sigma-70 family RNA polymerase sigma factor [Verrucomicrobiales bacterium]
MRPDTQLDLKTRRSLLSRLRNLDDHESWRAFFELYWRLLYQVARRAGLAESDAQDVVQETVVAVARKMPEFRYDPARGTFKHWLFRIVHRRIADHLRRLYRQPPQETLPNAACAPEDDSDSASAEAYTATIDAAWEQEWEQSIFEAAVAKVREHTNPRHFQVFDCCVRLGWPSGKVAATLSMNPAQVYLIRHRVSQAVKQAAKTINEERLRGQWMATQPAGSTT